MTHAVAATADDACAFATAGAYRVAARCTPGWRGFSHNSRTVLDPPRRVRQEERQEGSWRRIGRTGRTMRRSRPSRSASCSMWRSAGLKHHLLVEGLAVLEPAMVQEL